MLNNRVLSMYLCSENVSLLPDEIKLYTTCISDLFVITNFFLPILCLYSTDKAPNSHKPMIAEGRRMHDFFSDPDRVSAS